MRRRNDIEIVVKNLTWRRRETEVDAGVENPKTVRKKCIPNLLS